MPQPRAPATGPVYPAQPQPTADQHSVRSAHRDPRITQHQKRRDRGVTPLTADVSEFLEKGGGSVKCMIGDLGVLAEACPRRGVTPTFHDGHERRLANFVDFIGEGRGSQALTKALVETERRVEVLREEPDGLRRSREKVCQAPPVEWIEERLAGMQKVLARRTERSALLLRSLLGGIQLEPACGEIGRPY